MHDIYIVAQPAYTHWQLFQMRLQWFLENYILISLLVNGLAVRVLNLNTSKGE